MEVVYLAVVFVILTVIILVWLIKAKATRNKVFLDRTTNGSDVLSHTGEMLSDTKQDIILYTPRTDSTPCKGTLSDRYQDIIQKYLGEISGMNRAYYIDDKVYACIEEIALKDGRADLAPKDHETLSEWLERADIPSEYLELEGYLNNLFSNKHSDLLAKKREEYRINREHRGYEAESLKKDKKRIHELSQDLYKRNTDLIEKFLQIAERKVSIIDDYGDENWDALEGEIEMCLKKISHQEKEQIDWQYYKKSKSGLPDEYEQLRHKLKTVFLTYHKKAASREASIDDVHKMSGVEFETWVVKTLKENGFNNVRGTPAVGDQGADIIAERNGRNIIIQAKRHKGTVGNRAVQEVISAVQYYGGDEGWVITNSTFTPSAKALAQKSKIKLIDGKALSQIEDYI